MKLTDYFIKENISAAAFARQIKAHAPDVLRWANRRRDVPVLWCVKIEKATGGQVTRKDLRPDDWQEIWPELKENQE